MEVERWKVTEEFPDVEVSSLGRVRIGARFLTQSPNTGGYLQVSVHRRVRRVHRLVALGFLPNPDRLPLVCHRNGNQLDNRVVNLRWGTNADNMQDRIAHGNNPNLNKTHCLRKHLLLPPNLVQRKNGARICRSCEVARQALRRDPSRDLQGESDRYYLRWKPRVADL